MPPIFARDFRRTLLWIPRIVLLAYPYGPVTLSETPFQGMVRVGEVGRAGVQTPHLHRLTAADSVCPVPSSIAFTEGISVDFFSFPY